MYILMDTWVFFFHFKIPPFDTFKKESVLGDLEVDREMGAVIH